VIAKIKANIEWLLGFKVGNGFAFLLYCFLVVVYAVVKDAAFLEVASAIFAGLGVQTGQRTYTQVSLGKAQCAQQQANGATK